MLCIALLNFVIMLKSYHVIFFLCPFSTYIGSLAICSNGNPGVRQTGVASVCPLQLQFFNFRSAPYIQDCVVPPSALSQSRIWSFVPIQVAVESNIHNASWSVYWIQEYKILLKISAVHLKHICKSWSYSLSRNKRLWQTQESQKSDRVMESLNI